MKVQAFSIKLEPVAFIDIVKEHVIATVDLPQPHSASTTRTLDANALMKASMFLLVAISVLANPSHISTSGELLEVGLDWQVMVKLGISAVAAILGVWSIITKPFARRMAFSAPSLWVCAILVLGLPAALKGYSPSALPSIFINGCYLLFIIGCVANLRLPGIMFGFVLGGLMSAFFCWLIFFAFPDYGTFQEELTDTKVMRLSGLSHPNAVGRTLAFSLLALIGCFRSRYLTKATTLVLGLFLSVTLFFTLSRTSMLCCIAGISFLYLDLLRTRTGIKLLGVCAIAGTLFLFTLFLTGNESIVLDRVIGSVSKTGEASELTSLTGRSVIWTEAVRLIKLEPLTGYGIGAAQKLLVDFSQSPHNMFLHTAMVSGVFGMLILALLCLRLVQIGFVGQYRIVSAFAMCLIVSGLVEDSIFETFPAIGTLAFFLCMVHPIWLPSDRFHPKDEIIMSEDELQ